MTAKEIIALKKLIGVFEKVIDDIITNIDGIKERLDEVEKNMPKKKEIWRKQYKL